MFLELIGETWFQGSHKIVVRLAAHDPLGSIHHVKIVVYKHLVSYMFSKISILKYLFKNIGWVLQHKACVLILEQ